MILRRTSGRIGEVPAALLLVLVASVAPSHAQSATGTPAPAAGTEAGACAEGAQLFRQKQFARAEPLLKRCLEEMGERAEPLIYLTVIALQQKNSGAKEWGRRAVAADGQSADAHYWYGRALLAAGDSPGAQREWEAGIALNPEHLGLLEAMARLSMDRGEDAKAYGLLTQLQRQGVDEAWVHRLLSDLARRKGMWAEALSHWRDVLDREGQSAAGLLSAGELAILAGDTAAAVEVCRQAVALEPSAKSYGGLGEALFAADRHLEALTALREAVALDPDQASYQFNLANVLEVLGDAEEAEAHFQRFLTLDPDDPIGHFNYGIHLDKQDRSQEALAQVARAVELRPDWLAARLVLGQLQEKMGRYAEALANVDTLRAHDSENVPQLETWRRRLSARLSEVEEAQVKGKVQLLHIVTPDTAAVRLVRTELARGVDFAILATRFSVGPTAAQGGDIGWVATQDMVEPLRSAIAALQPQEISSAIESRGLYHFFKRLR
jgi:tetratricopeptide (TPR) repeat protein